MWRAPGIAGFTKTVALETAQQGVTCNAVCPGYMLTELVQNQLESTAKIRGITKVPNRHPGRHLISTGPASLAERAATICSIKRAGCSV